MRIDTERHIFGNLWRDANFENLYILPPRAKGCVNLEGNPASPAGFSWLVYWLSEWTLELRQSTCWSRDVGDGLLGQYQLRVVRLTLD